jgi:hypothetical protein
MLRRVDEGNSLYEVSRSLLESLSDSGGRFAVVQTNAGFADLVEGLENRLKAKGPEIASKLGLLQTIERLKLSGENVNILSLETPKRRGTIYCDLNNTAIIGLTTNAIVD